VCFDVWGSCGRGFVVSGAGCCEGHCRAVEVVRLVQLRGKTMNVANVKRKRERERERRADETDARTPRWFAAGQMNERPRNRPPVFILPEHAEGRPG